MNKTNRDLTRKVEPLDQPDCEAYLALPARLAKRQHWMAPGQSNSTPEDLSSPAPGGRIRKKFAFLRQRWHSNAINVSNIFLLPKFQGRGLNLALFVACQKEALKLGYRQALADPVHELNTRSLQTLEKAGV